MNGSLPSTGALARRSPLAFLTFLMAMLGASLVLGVSVSPSPASAATDGIVIDQILGSWQGDDSIQFVELRIVGPSPTLSTQLTAAALVFFRDRRVIDEDEVQVHRPGEVRIVEVPFLHDIGNGVLGARILIATPDLAARAGIDPDFVIEPGMLASRHGMVCYAVPFGPPGQRRPVDCVAYGGFDPGTDVHRFFQVLGPRMPDTIPGVARTTFSPCNQSLQRVVASRGGRAGGAPDTPPRQPAVDGIEALLEPTPQNNWNDRRVLRTRCGNGQVDPGESCDGSAPEPFVCVRCQLAGRGDFRNGADRGPRLVAGGGSRRTDCLTEWQIMPVTMEPAAHRTGHTGRRSRHRQCVDGDRRCDAGGVDGACTFRVGLCLGVDDDRLPRCRARRIDTLELRGPAGDVASSTRADTAALLTAVAAAGDGSVVGSQVTFPASPFSSAAAAPSSSAGRGCSSLTEIVVPLEQRQDGRLRRGRLVLETMATDRSGGHRDRDRITLTCRPAR